MALTCDDLLNAMRFDGQHLVTILDSCLRLSLRYSILLHDMSLFLCYRSLAFRSFVCQRCQTLLKRTICNLPVIPPFFGLCADSSPIIPTAQSPGPSPILA